MNGLASQVVVGTANAASIPYALTFASATWAALAAQWWLVLVSAAIGGIAYALAGQYWWRRYRLDPVTHGRGESDGVARRAGRGSGGRADRGGNRTVTRDLDPNLQHPARLRLMTMLTAVSEAEFSALRDHLDVADSVLSKHISALASVRYVNSRKGSHLGRRTTWVG